MHPSLSATWPFWRPAMAEEPCPDTPERWLPALLATSLGFASCAAWGTECDKWAARLISAQGHVEMQPSGRPEWREAQAEQLFCPGDKVRTQQQSRASLQLQNQTYLALDQRTTLVFSHVEADKPSWIELLAGSLFARSRTPKPLDIRAPFINAAIKGTEFAVSAGEGRSEVTVFEGEVEASSAAGKVTVTDGQVASARPGEKPRVQLALHPEDSVEWALYFPPLLDLGAAGQGSVAPALAQAGRWYAEGRLAEALAALEQVPEAQRDAEYTAFRVSLLLSVGRLDQAEPLLAAPAGRGQSVATVSALRSVIALARNRKAEALELADAALRADPNSPTAWMARSYALQAAFDLRQSLEAADRAAALRPGSALVQARRSTLLASLDRWDEAAQAAEQAIQLDARLARPWVIKGFIDLRDNDRDAARAAFGKAASLDAADPMARLGLGLAAIRGGDLVEGAADLELAASLDPSSSLVRSYLGKAYYEQKRNPVADKQFGLAKRLDPMDPTPWFYDAIMQQTENRPVEALHGLQKAIELNGNRAVYRSKLSLDEDLAARGAALGRIYGQIGFQPRALVEGWKSLADDPTDYTSHRLLSDSYSALPRHDISRVSELLQSQLLQPINIVPVQPQLAESSLFLLGGLGPSDASLQEFNPLFQRNRFSLLASGLVGSNDTYGDEVVHSGLWDDFSYSLGQFHYQTGGYRPNNDIDSNLYNAFVQGQVTPWLNVQAEYRHQDVQRGDLNSYFVPDSGAQAYADNYRQNSTTDTYRLGVHAKPSEHGDWLGSYIHLDRSVEQLWASYPTLGFDSQFHSDIGETQYIQRYERVKAILGGGYYQISVDDQGSMDRASQGNGYLYTQVRYPDQVNWTLGFSVDAFQLSSSAPTASQVNPKFGVLWNVTPDTVLRAAAFRTMKRSLLANQTLEPTQVAGFSQFFDDYNGTDATRWGVGLDQRFTPDWLGGAEFSRRVLELPPGSWEHSWRETWYRAYLLWTPHPRWSAGLEFFREDFSDPGSVSPPSTRTQALPLALSYYDPSGLYANFKATYFHQEVDLPDGEHTEDVPFLDLGLGYRLPHRWGLAEVQFQNLLDRNYQYEGLQQRRPLQTGGVPAFLPFPPEFTVFARLTLAF
jgi:tetratricopeptide (TPR) repeat protein